MAKRKKPNPLQRWLRKNFAKKSSSQGRATPSPQPRDDSSSRRQPPVKKSATGAAKRSPARSRRKKKTSGCLIAFAIFLGVILAVGLFFAYHYHQDQQRYLKTQEEKRIAEENAKAAEEVRKAAFLADVKTLALQCKKDYGILPSIAAAQAILESSWGLSQLSTEYNNYFGIKSLKESDQRVILPTYEYKNGEKIRVDEPFRAYDSMEQSFQHYGQLLSQAPIYQKVIQAKTYQEAAQALYDAGYSTDPAYPQKLMDIIRDQNLDQLDETAGQP